MKKIAQFSLFLLIFFTCVQPIFAQENKLDFFLKGGINIPNMDDINNIYNKDLEGYEDINYAYDFSTGFGLNITSNFTFKLGFNYLLHTQGPPTQLIEADGDTVDASINYQIKGLNPFLGIGYNNSFKSTYQYSFGVNLVYSYASLNDDLEDADTFFDYLKGNGMGFVVESDVRRNITENFDIGINLGYRLLNIQKLKINSKKYPNESKDIEFKKNGETLDLDFTGPFIRLMVVYKL